MNIGENIKKYRKLKRLTQKQLAENIGKSEITVRKYENNDTNPPLDAIDKMAKALNVSVTELIGNSEIFGRRLNQLIKDRNINGDDLAKSLEISIEEILEFESGKEPDITTLNKIANFFGVTADYLTGDSDFLTRTDENLIELAKEGVELGRFSTPIETDIMQKYHTEVKKIIDEHTSKLNEVLNSYYQAHIKVNRDEIFGVLIDVVSNLIYFADFIVKLSQNNNFRYSVDRNSMREDLQNGIINPNEYFREILNFSRKIRSIPHISEKVSSMLKDLEDEYCKKFDLSINIFVEHSKK
ncbi:helix-turn-helix domain-containing protein [Clostridium sp. WILCCON 0269]|uniref:Helix-turn-helix domain-containing protein n=1 Tax=Candidatus Clostridium eludens TaxID=3381663 RepID=A0ABW8SH31_9CLOT